MSRSGARYSDLGISRRFGRSGGTASQLRVMCHGVYEEKSKKCKGVVAHQLHLAPIRKPYQNPMGSADEPSTTYIGCYEPRVTLTWNEESHNANPWSSNEGLGQVTSIKINQLPSLDSIIGVRGLDTVLIGLYPCGVIPPCPKRAGDFQIKL